MLFVSFYTIVATAENTNICCSPSSDTVSSGETFNVDVFCIPTQPIKAFEFGISFNPSLLKANSVVEGNIFDNYTTFFDDGTIDNNAGKIYNVFGLIMSQGNVTDPGTFVTISFTAKQESGTSDLNLNGVGITDEFGYISISIDNASIEVQGGGGDGSSDGNGGAPPPMGEENNPPEIPMIPSGPTYIELGVEYEYSSTTFDVDDDLIRYMVDWGDGNFSNWSIFKFSNVSVNFTHSWDNSTSYEIKVIAQDEHGENSSWSLPLDVYVSQADIGGEPPVAIIIFPDNITANTTVVFNASGSYDIDGSIVAYNWDFGDGIEGSGISPTHSYEKPGRYIVTLVINDNDGYIVSKSYAINVGNEIVEESINENFVLPIDLSYLLFILVIAFFCCLMIFYRRKIKSFLSKSHSDFGLFKGILNKENKIRNIDEKIRSIRKEIDTKPDINQRFVSRQQESFDQVSNGNIPIHKLVDKEIRNDVIEKNFDNRYNAPTTEEKVLPPYDFKEKNEDNLTNHSTQEHGSTDNDENVEKKVDDLIDLKVKIKIDDKIDIN